MSDLSSPQPASSEHAVSPDPAADSPRSSDPSGRPSGSSSRSSSGRACPGPAQSFAGRCFGWLAALGPLTLLVFVAARTATGIGNRALFFAEELHLSEVYKTLAAGGNWAVLQFNGTPYVDLPPGPFWLLAGLERLPLLREYLGPDAVYPVASALGLFLFVLAAWLLAKATGNNNRVALASGVTALTALPVLFLARLGLPDFLFAACTAFSGACLYRGWIKNTAPVWMLCGFALAAAAALIQGPLGLGLPLLASLIFLIWRGSFRRGGARDGALGFALMLVLLLGWVSWLAMQPDGRPYLDAWLRERLIAPITGALTPSAEWWLPAEHLLLIWLPWTVLAIFLPWERLYIVPAALWKNRSSDPGTGWLWCMTLSGLALLCVFPSGRTASLLVVLPALAVLTARAALGLSRGRSRLFFGLLGLAMLGGALLFGLLALLEAFPRLWDWVPASFTQAFPDGLPPWLPQIRGLPWLAGVCALFALLSLPLDKRVPAGGLLLWLLFCTALAQPVNLITLPALAPLEPAVVLPLEPETEPAQGQSE